MLLAELEEVKGLCLVVTDLAELLPFSEDLFGKFTASPSLIRSKPNRSLEPFISIFVSKFEIVLRWLEMKTGRVDVKLLLFLGCLPERLFLEDWTPLFFRVDGCGTVAALIFSRCNTGSVFCLIVVSPRPKSSPKFISPSFLWVSIPTWKKGELYYNKSSAS